MDYANKLPQKCDVLLTDGFRYRLYDASADFQPVAYANLLALKQNAADLLKLLEYPRTKNAVPMVAGI